VGLGQSFFDVFGVDENAVINALQNPSDAGSSLLFDMMSGPAKPAKKKQIANLAVLRVATPAPSAFMPLIAKQIPIMRTLLNAAARSSLRLGKETLGSNRGSIACQTREPSHCNGFSNMRNS
jgi:hypothetical protein